jgi:hypothetical protein
VNALQLIATLIATIATYTKGISFYQPKPSQPRRRRSREMDGNTRIGGFDVENIYREAMDKQKADGIAQGRREAAEAWCSICDYISLGCTEHCVNRKAILGTASDEKTDKGEI